MTDILLPAISPTMEKGTLARWLVSPGEPVHRGDPIAEIETDKASVEIQAEHEGVLAEIVIDAGTSDVPVGAVIARLSQPGSVQVTRPSKAGAEVAARPIPRTTASHARAMRSEGGDAPIARGETAPTETRSERAGTDDAHVLASPLARRLARQLGIDLLTVRGTGERGRITKHDLENADARLRAASSRSSVRPHEGGATELVYPPPRNVPCETLPLSAMRKTIARRLGESKRTVPHFYMTVDVAMDALSKLRAQCNARPGAIKLSVNDFVLRAVALSLVRVPAANVQYGGDVIHRFQRVDLSFAVAVPEGLFTPVIRAAETKGVATIAEETRALVDKARTGRLHPLDYEGGTFSISNLGMYGIKQFEAVINPPQAAILAVGVTERRVVVGDDDLPRVQSVMSATLSCDHRVIDGAVGAELLMEIKRSLEDPLGLLLG
jgi:pyruvate dehydrogenase E2 component (dihydrolipoamide acetyltransferase)